MIYYDFGEEFEYEPEADDIIDFIISLGNTKDEAEKIYEDDEACRELLKDHKEEMYEHFLPLAEYEYEESRETFDGFTDYEDFCRWRNPNLK